MRFLVDECTGPAVARWLRGQQHDVFSVYEQARGMNDDEIDAIRQLLANYADRLADQFVVVTETRVRFARQ